VVVNGYLKGKNPLGGGARHLGHTKEKKTETSVELQGKKKRVLERRLFILLKTAGEKKKKSQKNTGGGEGKERRRTGDTIRRDHWSLKKSLQCQTCGVSQRKETTR